MKERGILFSGAMVRALIAETKTQTRRAVKPQPEPMPDDVQRVRGDDGFWWPANAARSMVQTREMPSFCPYGAPGDRLWVRETWADRLDRDEQRPADFWSKGGVWYRADGDETQSGCAGGRGRWRPSIHMPRWASRITLEVTEVRVQRLQDISEEDARAEGVAVQGARGTAGPRQVFAALWDSINGERAPWASNPWVWAISFERLS